MKVGERMKKYIDADALLQEIKDTDKIINHETYTAEGMHRAYKNVVAIINRMPAADVEPALQLQEELKKIGQSINANDSMVNWICDIDKLIKKYCQADRGDRDE
ncbi:MAG: hypothetical protein LUG99_00300 [Lachnospiraceae bacterium]|nr:hypothetical protein [Lachnospiraceae bacterium]